MSRWFAWHFPIRPVDQSIRRIRPNATDTVLKLQFSFYVSPGKSTRSVDAIPGSAGTCPLEPTGGPSAGRPLPASGRVRAGRPRSWDAPTRGMCRSGREERQGLHEEHRQRRHGEGFGTAGTRQLPPFEFGASLRRLPRMLASVPGPEAAVARCVEILHHPPDAAWRSPRRRWRPRSRPCPCAPTPGG